MELKSTGLKSLISMIISKFLKGKLKGGSPEVYIHNLSIEEDKGNHTFIIRTDAQITVGASDVTHIIFGEGFR